MTVFVVNMITDDVSRAQAFGDLKYVNIRYVYGDELDGDQLPAAFLIDIARHVELFDPERDYLLIAGDHLQLVQMAALLGKKFKRFRVLRWDRQAKGYIPVTITAGG